MSTWEPGEATALWLLWKRVHDDVRARIIGDMTARTGVSEPELTVIVKVEEAGGTLRQSAIAARLGWDRTRLSHLLTRMEARGYVARQKVAGGVEVRLLPPAEAVVRASAPDLEKSARRHLVNRLGPGEAAALDRILRRLLQEEDRR
ncbi:MarR family winged helix-turn-helix transcriptional regulator [Streptomyces calidiresistens]|uniref:MarR family transcriptional regulator n=1 Tax=Streptomyces calidiresistens TaxID=1485586 RepID=A0A7W3T6F9_9ACTN|nr:MarR family winged helix-turn-helix transcriptional regulator [Streptomyces calidiresistens]MBB0231616.1 MarR family transcriptional regulator [Streptomyces calidiresistens]